MTHGTGKSLRDLLTEMEPTDAARRDHYEKEVHDMIERKLTGPSKVLLYATSVMAVGIAALLLYLTFASRKGLPGLATFGLLSGACFALVWMWFLVSVLRKGTWNLKTGSALPGIVTWIFSVLYITIFAMLADRAASPVQALLPILIGLVFLIAGALILINSQIARTHLEIREKLLQIEQRLAALSENATKQGE